MATTVIYECRDCDARVTEPLSNFTDHPNSWVYTDFRCDACSENSARAAHTAPSDAVRAAAERWESERFTTRSGHPTERTVIAVMREGFEDGYRAAIAGRAGGGEVERSAQRYLEDLTPGGSEYANDPKRCYEWALGRIESSHRIAMQAALERNRLREAIKVELTQTEDEIRGLCRNMHPDKIDAYLSESPRVQRLRNALAAPAEVVE